MYLWHSVKEVEHKAVAFDVLTKVAKASYFTRVAALLYFSLKYTMGNLCVMLQRDAPTTLELH